MLLTDYGENKLVDFTRGVALPLTANLNIGLMTAVADGSFTEVSWSGYSRLTVARSLANWAGTQGPGTVTSSTGSSHQTSNNTEWNWGTAGGAATVVALGIFNGTDLFCWVPLASPVTYANGDPVTVPAGATVLTLGVTGGLSDFASNRLIDLIFRGQAFTWPANVFVRLMTSAPSNSGGGTEVAASGGYSSQSVSSSLMAWSGTQGAGSTTASTGTGGRTSNNASITYPAPTTSWGTVSHLAISDSAGVGSNLLYWRAMDAPRSIVGGGPAPRFGPNDLGVTFS